MIVDSKSTVVVERFPFLLSDVLSDHLVLSVMVPEVTAK